MKWDPAQYLKFEKERTQPAMDLLSRISAEKPRRVLDVGCGPGNSTRILADAFTGAEILGIDSSAEMVERARNDVRGAEFEVWDASDMAQFRRGKFGVIFSNACLQWVPDNAKVIADLAGLLEDGGVLAVQVPFNKSESVHVAIREILDSPKWNSKISKKRIFHTLDSHGYFDVLSALFDDFSIWKTVYYHVMDSHAYILEWYKGTGLRPYLAQLSVSDAEDFCADFVERMKKEYPAQANGKILFPFPRLVFTAKKS